MSVMSEEVYLEYLEPHSFKGHLFEAVHLHMRQVSEAHGVLPCNCQYQGQSKELPVLKNEGPTLFGRERLESIHLNWPLLCLETPIQPWKMP